VRHPSVQSQTGARKARALMLLGRVAFAERVEVQWIGPVSHDPDLEAARKSIPNSRCSSAIVSFALVW